MAADQTAYVIRRSFWQGPDDFQEIEKPDLESVMPFDVRRCHDRTGLSRSTPLSNGRRIFRTGCPGDQSRCDRGRDAFPEHIATSSKNSPPHAAEDESGTAPGIGSGDVTVVIEPGTRLATYRCWGFEAQ